LSKDRTLIKEESPMVRLWDKLFRPKLLKRTRSFRPALETLETRFVPAGFSIGPNVNVGHMDGSQSEPTIAIDPTNPAHLFVAANNNAGNGLYASYSTDGGAHWSARFIADGSDGLVSALGDPSAAFDEFGDLFLTYLSNNNNSIELLLSTDGGQNFKALPQLATDAEGGRLDQPHVATGPGDTAGTASVWVEWRDWSGPVAARGALITGPGTVGSYTPTELAWGSNGGEFGNIVVGPSGQVLVSYQIPDNDAGPSIIYVNLDQDGLGPGQFDPQLKATDTNVGGFRGIPAQPDRTIDAEGHLAWDLTGAHKGRVYLVYTDAVDTTTDTLHIMERYSDNNGSTWSSAVKVNDNTTSTSTLLPALAVDPVTGNLGVSWYDARNDPTRNTAVETYLTASLDGGQTFLPNVRVAAASSTTATNNNDTNDFGDYTSLTFLGNYLYPVWTDNGVGLPGNTDRPNFDIATVRVLLNTGDAQAPHFYVQGPLTTAAGQSLALTVVAEDANGNINTGYTGMVTFSSSDASAVLPATYTFTAADQGRHTFMATLKSTGDQTITATDAANTSMTGTSPKIGVPPATDPTAGQISGTVFQDYDADGAGGPSESPLPGQTIFLDTNGNGVLDPGEPATVTDKNGAYSFTGLAQGTYLVREVVYPGTVESGPANNAYSVTVGTHTVASNLGFGNILLSPLTPVAAPDEIFPSSPTADSAFVQGLYRNVLGRDADANGLEYWTARLMNGVPTVQVAQAIWESAEHRGHEVDYFYKTLLGRSADAGGYKYWVNVFLHGASEVDVAVAFLGSPEFQSAHPSNQAYVQAIYPVLLGRPVDSGGLTYWTNSLQGGTSRATVAHQIATSLESYTRMVDGLYSAFLQRAAAGGEGQFWVNRLRSGGSIESVAVGILASAEYFSDASSAVTGSLR
jgi:hypothetical protein